MDDLKQNLQDLEIEDLDVTEMIDSDSLSEQESTQIMGASCTTCVCTCSCCTT